MNNRVWMRRAYDPPGRSDGHRVLVDRVWPRGVTRDEMKIDEWRREIAPTNELRRWYGHKQEWWEEFRRRYERELSEEPERAALESLVEKARHGRSRSCSARRMPSTVRPKCCVT